MKSYRDFEYWIATRAVNISRLRKLDVLRAVVDSIPSSPEQGKSDWESGILTVITTFLEGRKPFGAIDETCFPWFEATWLDSIKEFEAYGIWHAGWEKGNLWSLEGEKRKHYLDACEHVRKWFLRREPLAPEKFPPAAGYLHARFLTENKADFTQTGTAELVKAKSKRWRDCGGKKPDEVAHQFVEAFYSNILPAIAGDDAAVRKVLQAFRLGAELDPMRIAVLVNCFEAALVAHFVHGDAVSDFEKKHGPVG